MEEASVAGESPDRSKQRESSAEPTPGSAAPVPETRDPRLAVAREKDSAPSGVDTATKILSIPDTTPSPEDTALRKAVSSWVRKANAKPTTGDEPEGGSAPDTGARAAGTDADAGARAAGTDAGAEAGAEADAGTKAEADAGTKAEAGAGTEAEADAATGADGGSGTGAEADGGRKAGNGGTRTDAGADSGADSKAVAGVKEEADAESDAGVASPAQDGADSDTHAVGDGRAEADVSADADRDGAEADTETDSDGDAVADAKSEPEEKAASEGAADAKAEPEGQDEPASKRQPKGEAKAAHKTQANGEADAESTAKADSEADAAPKAQANANPKTQADAAPKTQADPDTKGQADAEPKTQEKADPEARAKADSATPATAGPKPPAKAEAPAKVEPQDAAAAAAEARPELGDGEAEDSQSRGGAEGSKGAAGAEDAPQGGPAADDESRTGGDDADGEAEAEADTDAGDAPVDQPTAVFKAVRPKQPQVDQPTTMLKLGGKPKAPESDSERTSKFVALKNDMAPAKPKAEPDAKPDATTPVPQVGPERTTQQPLPPKPPLDLLAELTNTPPPPETAFRTFVRRVKIWTPLVLLLAVVFAIVQTLRPLPDPTLGLTAKDTYTFAGGKVGIPWPAGGEAALDVQGIGTFGSSGAQKPVPIASVAKVMTAYIVLRDHPLKSGADGPKIRIDKAAEQQSNAGQESTVHVTAGDSISQREALESILIASANNIARLLARWDAGSEKAFVARMNATAKSLGMTNTTYTDPSGLTDSTVSTAVDQVKLAKAAMTEPAFREVAAMMSYTDYKGVNHSNWNHLVGSNNVVGIKTGTTTSALGNLVFAAKQQVGGGTRTIIGAVLRQPAGGPENTILSAALDHSDQLIRAAQGALKSVTILKKGDVVGYVDDGLGGRTPVVATKDVTAAGWAGLKVKLSLTSGTVPHTAKAGTEVGSLTVGDGSAGAVKVPVALEKDLAEPGFGAKLTRLG
ncbi:D-alanyl-D-alanine carboxypeptidase [Streptomyces sp. NBC_00557]|uniref:D-alanyl-D-alanine carboxypeptidase n=1 Tax=Streptomyces sp. NBC_00557 TaxID=2975776 RepID=UPI002E821478|nr:D-alanyl-D-alanine carboxypeptidase [Streptomyces sp. NBC_00557]WUC36309.1 D-alanyl-D-alanine carboxypeptidase [Streptomyces sp. NBC_00557]